MEKIKWYQARWFWGAVVGVQVFPLIYTTVNIIKLKQNLFFILPRGFTETIYALLMITPPSVLPNFYIATPTPNYILYLYLFSIIFYCCFIILLLKTFKKKKVKIKFAIITWFVLAMSLIGVIMYFFMAS